MGIEVDRFREDIWVWGIPMRSMGPLPQSVVIAGHCKGSLFGIGKYAGGVVSYGWVGKIKVGVGYGYTSR